MSGIRLGLSRISRLLAETPRPWKAVHVAGTNGKGSVCNYTYGLLRASGVNCGMFTSPHLIDRWDCISLNGQLIAKDQFQSIEERIRSRNQRLKIDASSFELLTATAFEAFTEVNVDMAVIETGLGGIEDATNIIEKPAACVITKLGLDHEEILGSGMKNIVKHKSGIIKYQSACIIDGTNPSDVILMLEDKARLLGAQPTKVCIPLDYLDEKPFAEIPDWHRMPEHKKMHIILAYEAARYALQVLKRPQPDWTSILPSIASMSFPGRQQTISIQALTGHLPDVLLDGCHNEQSAMALQRTIAAKHQSNKLSRQHICWVLAASNGKNIYGILKHLLHVDDDVVVTEFGPVDGMPWVSSMRPTDIAAIIGDSTRSCITTASVLEALKKATEISDGLEWRCIVIKTLVQLGRDVEESHRP